MRDTRRSKSLFQILVLCGIPLSVAAFVDQPILLLTFHHLERTNREPQIRPTTQRVSSLSLFFRKGHSLLRKQQAWVPSEASVSQLRLGQVQFPYRIPLEYRGGRTTNSTSQASKDLIIRPLELRDLPYVVPMAVEEFGTGGPPLSIDEIRWEEVTAQNIQEYSDRVLFGPLVSLALEMKILRRQKIGVRPDYSVLCLEEGCTDGAIIGMVELSWQPPEAERNPPPVPLPFWAKSLWSRIRGLSKPDGWISNLLVGERHRGQGYSKILMSAAEGLARSWGCTAIYLHVDADTVSGRVAQSLYRSLGYEPVMDDRALQKYSWMGPELAKMGLYVVDGVPLLFLKKILDNKTL